MPLGSAAMKPELDVVGCRWDDLDPSLRWPAESAMLSNRDREAGSFADMLTKYEALSAPYPADRGAGDLMPFAQHAKPYRAG